MGRTLAIDYGDRRIGLAVSDLLNITAQPVGHITVNGDKDALNQIDEHIKDKEITKIVLGLPKNMDGSEGERAQKTRRFSEKLENRFSIDVVFVDERLTSVSATRSLNDMNVSGRKKKGKIDTLSAVLILQDYLRGV